jgi:Fe-S-cluster containining protein
MSDFPKPPFERTVCACAECVACCKRQPGHLVPGDAERIAEYLGEPVEPYLWDSQGALVLCPDGIVRRARTMTPRMVKGRCIFLDENDRCKIHKVAPFGCAYVDTHMSKQKGQERSQWAVRAYWQDEGYNARRKKLPLATSYKPGRAI